MHYLVTAATLYLFWLLLSGLFTVPMLCFGLLSVIGIIWVLRRMDRVDGEVRSVRATPRLIGYAGWLLWAVVKSGIDVAKRIWDPRLPIRPTWRRLEIPSLSAAQKTLYANSITLTPGTLTTDVGQDHFMVHSLTEEGMRELDEGEMGERIRRLKV